MSMHSNTEAAEAKKSFGAHKMMLLEDVQCMMYTLCFDRVLAESTEGFSRKVLLLFETRVDDKNLW